MAKCKRLVPPIVIEKLKHAFVYRDRSFYTENGLGQHKKLAHVECNQEQQRMIEKVVQLSEAEVHDLARAECRLASISKTNAKGLRVLYSHRKFDAIKYQRSRVVATAR